MVSQNMRENLLTVYTNTRNKRDGIRYRIINGPMGCAVLVPPCQCNRPQNWASRQFSKPTRQREGGPCSSTCLIVSTKESNDMAVSAPLENVPARSLLPLHVYCKHKLQLVSIDQHIILIFYQRFPFVDLYWILALHLCIQCIR